MEIKETLKTKNYETQTNTYGLTFVKSEVEKIIDDITILKSKNKSFEIKCSYTDLVEGADLKEFSNKNVDNILAEDYTSCVLIIESSEMTTKVYFNIQNNFESTAYSNYKGKTFVTPTIDTSTGGDYPVLKGVKTLTVSTIPTASIIYTSVNIEVA